jgi:hypothetical protein
MKGWQILQSVYFHKNGCTLSKTHMDYMITMLISFSKKAWIFCTDQYTPQVLQMEHHHRFSFSVWYILCTWWIKMKFSFMPIQIRLIWKLFPTFRTYFFDIFMLRSNMHFTMSSICWHIFTMCARKLFRISMLKPFMITKTHFYSVWFVALRTFEFHDDNIWKFACIKLS